MSEWTISDERAFIENLLCQRFNFFLVFFSIVSAGAITSFTFSLYISLITLAIGNLICWPLRGVLRRSQEKLDIILDHILPEEYPQHPAFIIDKKSRKGGSRRRVIGETIPSLCCGILVLAFFGEILYLVIRQFAA